MRHADAMLKPVILWLMLSAALVAAMVLLGGYTRLSGAGLSITEWKPIHGTIPPLSLAEWEEEFAAYRRTPQFAQVNQNMKLDGFKTIFWPEYSHRLLGRAVGIVFFLPLMWFYARKTITPRFALSLLGIFALGGLQGLMGWWMVKSGLSQNPHVSHFRLSAHLALAFLIFALLEWVILKLVTPAHAGVRIPASAGVTLKIIFILLCLQILTGAFMAGLHAGLIYNTFPNMNGEWLPGEALQGNPLENIALIQFTHRWLAKILAVSYFFWWLKWGRSAMAHAVGITTAAQVALGIFTLLYQVPKWLALAHQFTALALFALMLALLYNFTRRHAPETRPAPAS
jgi:cytochrome c oxidase assembly protein subunit 15